MWQRRGLIDSNVLVAASTMGHIHHDDAAAVMVVAKSGGFATSIHCLSEFYNISTRGRARGGSEMSPSLALSVLDQNASILDVLSLSITEHIAALRQFARFGRIGPQVYDFLIGHIAVVHDIPAIITWNTRHMVPLFPQLRVVTPIEFTKEA